MIEREHWTFDKRIPLAFLFAVFLQTVGAVWWASAINSSVSENEKDIAVNTKNISQNTSQVRSLELGITRIDTKLDILLKSYLPSGEHP